MSVGWGRRPLQLAAIVLVVLFVGRWPFRARHLYEWDSAQYALGVLDFDIYRHQPHPPGYPVWIALLKCAHRFESDLNLIQVAGAFLVSAAAAYVLYRAARDFYGEELGLFTTACVAFSAPAIVASVHANTYPIDLLASATLGWLAARLWNGEKRLAPLATAAIAIFAGARQSGAVLMAPVLGIALLRACRFDFRIWATSVVTGVVPFVLWYVPVVRMHNGVAQFQKFQSDNVRSYFSQMSFFYGAPGFVHRAMLNNIAHWTAMMVGVTVAFTVMVGLVGLIFRREHAPALPGVLRAPAIFFALWIVPNTVYTCAFHCPKPGYLLLTLPPIALIATSIVGRGLGKVAVRFRVAPGLLAAVCAVIVASSSTAMASLHYNEVSTNRASLSSVRESDEGMEAIEQLVKDSPTGADGCLIIVLGGAMFGPNYRSLAVESEAEIWTFENATLRRTTRDRVEHNWEVSDKHDIPSRIRRLIWVHHPHIAMGKSLRAAFPETREGADTMVNHVWVTDIGERGVDAHVTSTDISIHFAREGSLSPGCQLGKGWFDVILPTDLIWALGASSDFVIRLDEDAPVRVEFGMVYSPASGQHVRLTRDGVVLAEADPGVVGDTRTTLAASFDGHAGENVVHLEHAAFNGAPTFFNPVDRRLFAALYGTVSCSIGDKEQKLVP